MSFRPDEWNIVIAGAWNPAILTPDGIRGRLLELPAGTPVTVEISIDLPGFVRVRQEGLIIAALPDRLVLAPEVSDLASMRKASEAGRRALESLNQTPVRAAGVNFRYRCSPPPQELSDAVRAPLDQTLDGLYSNRARATKRSLDLAPGAINLELRDDGETMTAELNFHLDSTEPSKLAEWLGDVDGYHTKAEALLAALGVRIEGVP